MTARLFRAIPLALGLALTAGTAVAAERPTAADFRNGRCTVRHLHVPAGKIAHLAPIIRCADPSQVARNDKPNPAPAAAKVERD